MNLLYEPFPDSVTADGRTYTVPTDFREWLRFADLLADAELTPEEKAYLCGKWLTPEPERITAEIVTALLAFYRADSLYPVPEPDDGGETEPEAPPPPVFDWSADAAYLLGDFLRYYRIDLMTARLHWWIFRALFDALPEDSRCMKRIAYRGADLSKIRDRAERARIAKIQKQIALPHVFDDSAIADLFAPQ